MRDIWSFLLQTLTVSSVGLIIIILKKVFKDTLPPKWHFAMWGIVGIFTLIPASIKSTYILFNENFILELLKGAFGEYGATAVTSPFPIITEKPDSAADYIFIVYALGVFAHLAFYAASYIKLRITLKKCTPPSEEALECIKEICGQINVKPCKVVELDGIKSAFVCGVIKPVLVLPENVPQNGKVILHELYHLKHRDTLWSVVICILRSLQWCNPFLVYCASAATNDMERRCDQYVLEFLSGEERRDYGHILLSMANDRFTKTPCTTCVNNGGKNIKKRIETIAKFKLYPKGMKLVSVCIALSLTVFLFTGTTASAFKLSGFPQSIMSAAAKSTPCTTYAGAFDTYAAAVSRSNGYYRMMCASDELRQELSVKAKSLSFGETEFVWDSGFPIDIRISDQYAVLNLEKLDSNSYRGTILFCPWQDAEGYELTDEEKEALLIYNSDAVRFVTQTVVVKKEAGRWFVDECGAFETIYSRQAYSFLEATGLPSIEYTAPCGDYLLKITYRTFYTASSEMVQGVLPTCTYYSKHCPEPNAKFKYCSTSDEIAVTNISDSAKNITSIGVSYMPVHEGEPFPEVLEISDSDDVDTALRISNGNSFSSRSVENGILEENESFSLGGGSAESASSVNSFPEYFAASFYINGEYKESTGMTRETEETK